MSRKLNLCRTIFLGDSYCEYVTKLEELYKLDIVSEQDVIIHDVRGFGHGNYYLKKKNNAGFIKAMKLYNKFEMWKTDKQKICALEAKMIRVAMRQVKDLGKLNGSI